MAFSKQFLLCADDFGLSEGISQGIIELAQKQRLSDISCMTNVPLFAAHSKMLLGLQNRISLGLHFNLTEGFFLSTPQTKCYSLKNLLIKSHARCLDKKSIAKELKAQLECYVDLVGKFPNFIDGHQHVHQFPQIREVLLQLYEEKFKKHGVYIRSTYPAVTFSDYKFKTKILAYTGGKRLQSRLLEASIPHNASFAGIYDFSELANYRSLFRKWLAVCPDETLIMCHPAMNSDDVIDHAITRKNEFDYFSSDDFLSDCQAFNARLATSPKPRDNEVEHSYQNKYESQGQ